LLLVLVVLLLAELRRGRRQQRRRWRRRRRGQLGRLRAGGRPEAGPVAEAEAGPRAGAGPTPPAERRRQSRRTGPSSRSRVDSSEFDLIAAIDGRMPAPGPRVRIPSGDDAAVVEPRAASAVTVDAIVDGVHFLLDSFGPEAVGRKALGAALS